MHARVMTPLTSSTSTILAVGLTSNEKSIMDLRTIAEWIIRLRLLAVPGVANVETFGSGVLLSVAGAPDTRLIGNPVKNPGLPRSGKRKRKPFISTGRTHGPGSYGE